MTIIEIGQVINGAAARYQKRFPEAKLKLLEFVKRWVEGSKEIALEEVEINFEIFDGLPGEIVIPLRKLSENYILIKLTFEITVIIEGYKNHAAALKKMTEMRGAENEKIPG